MQEGSQYESYLAKIESLRGEMEKASKKHGINHPLVLKYSQELDQMHNIIISLECTKKNTVF